MFYNYFKIHFYIENTEYENVYPIIGVKPNILTIKLPENINLGLPLTITLKENLNDK